ncbi:MAG TPA: biotin transporter BioY [Candidatus Obscuribacterales bacterium]
MNWAITGNIRRLRRKSLIGQLVLLALGVELLIFASFTTLPLPTPTQHNIERLINSGIQQVLVYLPPNSQQAVLDQFPVLRRNVPPIRVSPYVPLCPIAIFLGYVLGVPLGFLAALGFVILGLVGPKLGMLVFAAGGGFAYYKQPSFGYLLGLIGGAWFAGRITAPSNTSFRQLLAIVGGLVNIHLLGLLYLVGGSLMLLLFDGAGTYLNWQPWLFETIRNFSWYSLPYDCLFSLALVGLGFPFRWLNGILTAPDIGVKPRPKFDRQLEHVS